MAFAILWQQSLERTSSNRDVGKQEKIQQQCLHIETRIKKGKFTTKPDETELETAGDKL